MTALRALVVVALIGGAAPAAAQQPGAWPSTTDWLIAGGALTAAALIALLLGLRHATDPDHLTAVPTLILSERGRGRAGAAPRLSRILG